MTKDEALEKIRKLLRNRQAFLYGFWLGLTAKLDQQKKAQVSGDGLVLLGRAVKLRDDYMKKNFLRGRRLLCNHRAPLLT